MWVRFLGFWVDVLYDVRVVEGDGFMAYLFVCPLPLWRDKLHRTLEPVEPF